MEPTITVCDLFASLQGEGAWAGRPVLFLRCWGCPLNCPWCDEPRHRRPEARRTLAIPRLLEELAALTPQQNAVVITGGEPLAQPHLPQLVAALKARGYWVAMESAGVGGDIPPGLDWLTLSPKTPLPAAVIRRADELKFIVGPDPTPEELATIDQHAAHHPLVWVQPRARGERLDPAAIARCHQLVMASGGRLRLSLQIHKLIGIP